MPTNATTAIGRLPTESPGKFYVLRGRDSLANRKAQRSNKGMVWDPWLVKNFKEDVIFETAKKLVQQRNLQCVDICVDKIVLLPASGNIAGIQGGSKKLLLYSLRSPDTLPIKFHMWEIPAVWKWNGKAVSWTLTRPKKVMVRHGRLSEPLTNFLQSFGVVKKNVKECDLCTHFSCWRGLKVNHECLAQFPEHLRDIINQRWWNNNGFRFLDLSPELREAVLEFTVTPSFEPHKGPYEYDRRNRPNQA